MKKLNMSELFQLLQEQHSTVALRVYESFKNKLKILPGSIAKHQTWEGGLEDHLEEVMNIAVVLFSTMNELRKLPFTLSDALFVLFLHDSDKLLRYSSDTDGQTQRLAEYSNHTDYIRQYLEKNCQYSLTEVEYNALKYTHGEGADYSKDKRVMGELAAFVHCCDTISARIWHDYGQDSQQW